MKTYFILIFFFLVVWTGKALGQDSVIHPYLGAGVNIISYYDGIGFGIEVGLEYNYFYAGAEYGIYSTKLFTTPNTADRPSNYIPPDELQDFGQYFGFHAGIMVKNKFWFGAVFLVSKAILIHSSSDSSTMLPHTWFNVGPDIRIIASEHLTFNFAYTIQRGLKLGLGYVFERSMYNK